MARHRIVFSYFYMSDVVAFALEMLKEKSPVGGSGDKHAGLYRDSHYVFLNGHSVTDVSAFRPGDEIHISNPEPYSVKIESGLSVPGHTYEDAVQVVAARYAGQANIKFVYLPVQFGAGVLSSSTATGRVLSSRERRGKPRFHTEWLSHQPAMLITR